jgi:hypothetical protein
VELGRLGAFVGLLVFAVAAAPSAAGQLETRSNTPFLGQGWSAAVGDFNGDGKLDVAVVLLSSTNNIAILLGNGDGTFRQPTYYSVGDAPPSIVTTASLRNDGRLDLVVGESLASNFYVLLGNGDGTFEPAAAYATQEAPIVLGAADFNNDGAPDIWVVSGDLVEILLNNGNGTFGAPILTTVATSAFSAAVGDFNNDGNLDIVLGEAFGTVSQIQVLLGNGNGTFRDGTIYATDGLASKIVADQFVSGSQNVDLAVAAGGLQFFFGNGDGTFRRGHVNDRSGGLDIIEADFNGDGIPDLISTTGPSSNFVAVALGNGDGTFQPNVSFPLGDECVNPAVGDFNGDGMIDVAVPDYYPGSAVITLLNTGVVDFSPTKPLNFGNHAIGTTSAPLEVMLINTGTKALSIGSVNVTGEFKLNSTNCRRQLAAGGKCSISVVFTPQSKGSQSGTISIDDSASSKPQVVELSGTGK